MKKTKHLSSAWLTIKWVVLMLFLVNCQSKSSSVTSSIYDSLDIKIKQLQKTSNFNGVVLVGNSKEILFHESYGWEDMTDTTKGTLSKQDNFYLASVTKNFVAVSLMKLRELGKIQLSDPIVKYVPELAGTESSNVTIAQLLSHTSGLPNDYTQFYSKLPKGAEFNNTKLLEFLKEVKLEFEPGTSHAYSNVGYIVLAIAIEKVSGASFIDFLNDQVTDHQPEMVLFENQEDLELLPSFYQDSLLNWVSYSTGTYEGIKENTYGDGGLVGSAMDLFRWGGKLLKNDILTVESRELAFTPYVLNDSTTIDYGFGIRTFPEKDFYYHGGGSWGYSHLFSLYPENDLIIVVLSNSDMWGSVGVVFKEVEAYMKKYGRLGKMPVHIKTF